MGSVQGNDLLIIFLSFLYFIPIRQYSLFDKITFDSPLLGCCKRIVWSRCYNLIHFSSTVESQKYFIIILMKTSIVIRINVVHFCYSYPTKLIYWYTTLNALFYPCFRTSYMHNRLSIIIIINNAATAARRIHVQFIASSWLPLRLLVSPKSNLIPKTMLFALTGNGIEYCNREFFLENPLSTLFTIHPIWNFLINANSD